MSSSSSYSSTDERDNCCPDKKWSGESDALLIIRVSYKLPSTFPNNKQQKGTDPEFWAHNSKLAEDKHKIVTEVAMLILTFMQNVCLVNS